MWKMLKRSLSWKIAIGFFILALTVLLTLTGCNNLGTTEQPENQTKTADTSDKDGRENSASKPDISAEPKDTMEKATLYFADKDAMYLVPEEREVTAGNKKLEEAVVNELIKGPRKSDVFQTVPKEAKLISLEVVDGIAYVNFNQEFQTKHWGGSAGEAMTLYSITNSLAKLPGIEKVQFLIEGKKEDAVLGHADTTEPLAPNWSMVKE